MVFSMVFVQDYIKKLERERFEADLKEAHDVLAHMGNRLQSLEQNDQSVRTTGRRVEGAGPVFFVWNCLKRGYAFKTTTK